ncbi:MAG: shikimate dehydrogenase [Anditalea sp.]
MRKFGLIGHPLKHSFSKGYFTEKFEDEGLVNCQYELFQIDDISKIRQVLSENPELVGLNVTIPYKEQVIPYLDHLEPACQIIGAVNTIKIDGGKLTGFNTDYIGFKESLNNWWSGKKPKALVLGSGGASKAVKKALTDLDIVYLTVSRSADKASNTLTYQDLFLNESIFSKYHLIINTTPLGTYPNTEEMPPLPLNFITEQHKIYDLVYNPEKTLLMKSVEAKGGDTKNGLEMLHLQAEAAWEIWNKN